MPEVGKFYPRIEGSVVLVQRHTPFTHEIVPTSRFVPHT
jgi:hypothetical protein